MLHLFLGNIFNSSDHRTEHADLQERFLKVRFYVRRRSSRVCLIRFKVVALYKWAAMEKLSNAERAAELVYDGMRRGKLSRDDFVRKMSGLESLGKEGVISTCYATFLLLRSQPPSKEKQMHWDAMTARLRAAINDDQTQQPDLGKTFS